MQRPAPSASSGWITAYPEVIPKKCGPVGIGDRSELRNLRLVRGMSTSRHWRPAIYEAGSTLEWIVTPRENSALNDRSGLASFWW
jgi:hypothetical protein